MSLLSLSHSSIYFSQQNSVGINSFPLQPYPSAIWELFPIQMELSPGEGHKLHSHNPRAAQLGTPGNRAKLHCFSSLHVEIEVCNGRCQYTLLLPEPPLITILRAGIKALLTHYHVLQARTGWEGQVCLNQYPTCNFTTTTLTRDCPLD